MFGKVVGGLERSISPDPNRLLGFQRRQVSLLAESESLRCSSSHRCGLCNHQPWTPQAKKTIPQPSGRTARPLQPSAFSRDEKRTSPQRGPDPVHFRTGATLRKYSAVMPLASPHPGQPTPEPQLLCSASMPTARFFDCRERARVAGLRQAVSQRSKAAAGFQEGAPALQGRGLQEGTPLRRPQCRLGESCFLTLPDDVPTHNADCVEYLTFVGAAYVSPITSLSVGQQADE